MHAKTFPLGSYATKGGLAESGNRMIARGRGLVFFFWGVYEKASQFRTSWKH
jgi:hypothetical protein